MSVDLVYGYPAILISLAVGLVAAWRRRVLFAIVNAGAWALGIGMAVAVAGLRRDPHPR